MTQIVIFPIKRWHNSCYGEKCYTSTICVHIMYECIWKYWICYIFFCCNFIRWNLFAASFSSPSLSRIIVICNLFYFPYWILFHFLKQIIFSCSFRSHNYMVDIDKGDVYLYMCVGDTLKNTFATLLYRRK